MRWWGQPDPTRQPNLAEALELGRWNPSGPLERIQFVVFDTETTGFHPYAGDEIISLAARRLDSREEYDTLVNPGRPVPQIVTDLTGITADDLIAAPKIWQALEQFLRFAGISVLVAHCVDFDRAFMEVKLHKAGRLRWTHPVLDTQVLAQALYPWWRDYRLEHCASRLETTVEMRHTALGDTRTTARILEAMLEECSRRGLTKWEQVKMLLHERHVW